MNFLSRNAEETKTIGKQIGRLLKKGDTVCLYGDLGAGKTTLVKGIAGAFGIPDREITSASFTIVAEHYGTLPLYHIDLYRLDKESEVESTGVYEYIGGDGVAVVEWAERLDARIDAIKVTIKTIGEDEREIWVETEANK